MSRIYCLITIFIVLSNTGFAQETRKVEKEQYYASLLIGPHWSSKFYSSDVNFEQGKLTPFSFGIDIGTKLSKKWFLDSYFYYLPTQLNEGDSGFDFAKEGSSVKYTNNIYGLRVGYTVRGNHHYRLSLISGLSNHIIGGLKRTDTDEINVEKFAHLGVTVGGRLEYKITKNWVFDSDLAYIHPLDIDNTHSFSGNLWYRGLFGVKWRWNKNLRLAFEYQLIYHNSDFIFSSDGLIPSSANQAESEFFIQTLMLGIRYRFDKLQGISIF